MYLCFRTRVDKAWTVAFIRTQLQQELKSEMKVQIWVQGQKKRLKGKKVIGNVYLKHRHKDDLFLYLHYGWKP